MGAQQADTQQPQIVMRKLEFRGSMELSPNSPLDVDYVREAVDKLRERGVGDAFLILQTENVERGVRLDI